MSAHEVQPDPSSQPADTTDDFGPIWGHLTLKQRVQATMVRLVCVGFFALSAIVFLPRNALVWGSLAVYMVLAVVRVMLVGTGSEEKFIPLRVGGFLVLDVAVVTLMVYATGPSVSLVSAIYLLLIVAYTVHRGPRYGVAAVILSCVGLGTVLTLECLGQLPWQPQLVIAGATVPAPVVAWSSFSTMTLVMVASLYIMCKTAQRQAALYRKERHARLAAEDAIHRTQELQAQLEHSQRLESLGRLAGGVAHDFNNLLTGILGYTGIVHGSLDDEDAHKADLDEVLTAADHAHELTTQLLAFSRKQVIQPRRCSLGGIVSESEKMLRRLIGEHIKLETWCTDQGHVILVDKGQVSQVLVNLVVNARDAMPRGGTIHVKVDVCSVSEEEANGIPDMDAGDHVRLQVIDSGVGMDRETLSHIFEPFFSTKAPGKGTGLGLSTVYGIVKQSGGAISVRSELSKGTCFRICYPTAEGSPSYDVEEQVAAVGGDETILLVEDDPIVRNVTDEILSDAGYEVLACSSGEEAIDAASSGEFDIQLLLSDVVLTGINGREAATRIQDDLPDVRVLFMSGYTAGAFDQEFTRGLEVPLLPKPFRPEHLLARVRQTLDHRIADWTAENL